MHKILKKTIKYGAVSYTHLDVYKRQLQDFQLEANYELINEHIFSRDGSTLLMFITPVFNTRCV